MKKISMIIVMLLIVSIGFALNFERIEQKDLRSIYKKIKRYEEANKEDLRYAYKWYPIDDMKGMIQHYMEECYSSPRHKDYSSVLVQPLKKKGYVIVIRHKFSFKEFGGGRVTADKVFTFKWGKPDNIDLDMWLPMHIVNYSEWKKKIGKIQLPHQ